MPLFIAPVARAAVAATFLGAVALAAPGFATKADAQSAAPQSSSPQAQSTTGAQAPTTQTPGVKPHHHRVSYAERVEARIKELHSELQITKEQEPQWDAVALVMRDDAKHIGELLKERREKIGTMSAVDDLRSFQGIAQAHADGLAKLAASFQTLYDSMSDAQKKNADTVFRHFEGHHRMGHAKAKKQQP